MLSKKNYTILSCVITFVYFLPFLLSPYNFMDDFYRSANGDLITWYQNARPLSIMFFRLLNGSFFPSDPFPFSFLFSFVILYFIVRYIVDNIISENNFLFRLSVFILFLCNPFFLQNLSYKYDCVMMVMSVLCASFFVFNKKAHYKTVNYISKFCLIFALYCFYQPALSLVCGLIAIKMLIDIDKSDNFVSVILEVIYNSIFILLAFIVYKICIANLMLEHGFIAAGKVISINNYFFKHIFNNISGYLQLLSFFIYKKYILISIILVCVLFLLTIIKNLIDKSYKRILVLVCSIPLLCVSLTSCNIVLSAPMFHMREMMGVSAVFVYIFLYIYKNKWISKIILCLPFSFLLVSLLISSAICNLKRIEYVKDELVVQDILRSINYFGINQVEGISFISDDLLPPDKKNILKNYFLLEYLFDHSNFTTPWYANGILNGEFYLHKIILGEKRLDFPSNVKVLRGCYTETALKGVILYVKVGSFCNSFPKYYNAGVF